MGNNPYPLKAEEISLSGGRSEICS
jgi:hypothetical protein